jgi:hypothetical protein
MMDTKSLMEAAVTARLNLRDEDLYQDLAEVAIDAIWSDSEYLSELTIDILCDKPDGVKEMLVDMNKERHSLESLRDSARFYGQAPAISESTFKCIQSQASMASMYDREIGKVFSRIIVAGVIAHVEKNVEDWAADIQSYCGDMEEAMMEDAADARMEDRRDRELDERA